MTVEQYIRDNPEHSVTVEMNVQAGEDKRLRVTFQHRQGPYRPKLLGVYVVKDFKEALANLNAAQELKEAPKS